MVHRKCVSGILAIVRVPTYVISLSLKMTIEGEYVQVFLGSGRGIVSKVRDKLVRLLARYTSPCKSAICCSERAIYSSCPVLFLISNFSGRLMVEVPFPMPNWLSLIEPIIVMMRQIWCFWSCEIWVLAISQSTRINLFRG